MGAKVSQRQGIFEERTGKDKASAMKTTKDMIMLGRSLAQPLRRRWSTLRKRDIASPGGREYLIAKIQERYGLVTDAADRQAWDFTRDL